MAAVAGLLLAYVLGSIPSAYLAGRVIGGIDLRTVGSGNLGATNVYRHLGAPAALVVLLVDAAKGAAAVQFLPSLLLLSGGTGTATQWWSLAYGAMAIVGHSRPVFLLGRGGGKGVATAAGMFSVVVPVPLLASVMVCAAAVWASGYMSVGSVLSAAVFPVLVGLLHGVSPAFWASLAVAAFVVWSHRANFQRLRTGTEPRLFPKRGGGEGRRA